MNTALWYPHGYDPQYAQCWALSILLHGTVIGLAIASLSDLHLAPQPDAFRWQVSVVGTTNQPGVQKSPTAPMEPHTTEPTPAIPSVNESPPVQKTVPVTRQAVRPKIPEQEPPARIPPEKQEESVAKQIEPIPHIGLSPNVPPQVTAPPDLGHSPPSETAIPAPSPSTRPGDGASSGLPPPASSSAPAEDPAISPSRDASMVARAPIDMPPASVAPAHIPETSSSTGYSSRISPSLQEARKGKPDFSWLTDSLRNKVQESQRYSTVARLNGLEGRVVLRITVKENGELIVAIMTSSGHDVLDQDAVEQVKRLSPLPLPQPLGRAQQVLNLPIIYSLNQ